MKRVRFEWSILLFVASVSWFIPFFIYRYYDPDELISKSNHKKSGSYLEDYEELASTLSKLEKEQQKSEFRVGPNGGLDGDEWLHGGQSGEWRCI